MEYFVASFITGLTTGGISCFAVQGSLLATVLATGNKVKTLVIFLTSKLIAHTVLGFLLGVIGKSLIISPKAQGWLQIIIGVYMIITAVRLLGIHPFFRKFVITPPKFILKYMRRLGESNSLFVPIFLGILTVFIPCGVTQGMMLLAVSASIPVVSAGILFAFVLGTIPVFFAIGMAAGEIFKHKLLAILAAIVISILGIFSINSGQVLRGSVHTVQNYWRVLTGVTVKQDLAMIKDGYQYVDITVTSRGYTANTNTLKAGVPVRLTLTTDGVLGCSRAFTIPDQNLFKLLPVTGTEVVEFTPEKPGTLIYTCSMGMYSGAFQIVD
jgi:sulfite exporter TauE/SafE